MIPEAVLAEAVGKGLVTTGQAEALRSLARQRAAPPPRVPEPVDAETLRLVTGFADIFVAIGIVLFLGAAAYLLDGAAGGALPALAVAVLSWGLAEFFTRAKRMALPSILLLLCFVVSGFVAILQLMGGGGGGVPLPFGWLGPLLGLGRDGLPGNFAAAALGTAGLAALHYARFRVPITVAAGAAFLVLALLMMLEVAAPAFTARSITGLLGLAGIAIFALAMRFDLADPARKTRRTDIAFWLHLVAAPLIVRSVFAAFGVGRGLLRPDLAVGVLAVFLVLGAVAVLVDRRAMLVSGLVYAGTALGSLIGQAGFGGRTAPVTLLGLGAFVLVLSAGWTPLRRAVLARLPDALADRLPPSRLLEPGA